MQSTGSDFILAADSTSQAYFDPAGPKSCRNALAQLATYLELEGPFDGVLAFSQGAVLAATLLVQAAQNAPHRPVRRNYGLKCAVFISGGPPADPSALGHDDVKVLSAETVGEIIQLPTAHIWDPNDTMMPGSSAELSKLCSGALKSESLHNLGHEVPGPRSQEALNEAVHAVRRTVERAALAQ